MKRKEIIKELEHLYVARFEDYKKLMDEGNYEDAQKACNDCSDILVKMEQLGSKRRLSPMDIATLTGNLAIGTAGLVSDNYWRYQSFKFEENGTISSPGGKKMIGESFQKFRIPKI